MAEENITPEEKLLKLIENPLDKTFRPALKKAHIGAVRLKGLIRNLRDFNRIKTALSSLKFSSIIKLLLAVSVLSSAFLIFDFFKGQRNSRKNLKKILSPLAYRQGEKSPISLKSREEYLEETRRRNVFSPVVDKAYAGNNADLDSGSKVKDLKLVGIIWSKTPQAIIEDTKGNKTYLLGETDEISQLKIKKIFTDKVVIGSDEKEWELR